MFSAGACATRGREEACNGAARTLTEFHVSFPDEASCAAFLFKQRWPVGFVCPACGGGRAASPRSRAHTCECLTCGHLSFGAPKIGHLVVERRGHLTTPSRPACHSMIPTPRDFVRRQYKADERPFPLHARGGALEMLAGEYPLRGRSSSAKRVVRLQARCGWCSVRPRRHVSS